MMATMTMELPGATQFRAWEEAVRRQGGLRKQLLETNQEIRRAQAELERLATEELEKRDYASQGELDRINAMAETATARLRELSAWAGKLKQQLETLEKELPELRKQAERTKAEMAKTARAGHERAVSKIANGIREVLEGNKEEQRWMQALADVIGEEATRYLQPLTFLPHHQIEQSAEYWFNEAKRNDYKV